jgi:tetratricopeptide (TPR) repeat protein
MQAHACWRRNVASVLAAAALSAWAVPVRAQFRDTIPSRLYYAGVEQLYRGDYRDAQRTFQRGLTGAIKTLGPNGQIRWIDSICYHAMLGETYYHWGQPAEALEQFDLAAALFLQYPRWMLRVQFDVQPKPSTQLARIAVPWGASQRQSTPGEFADTFAVAQGSINNQQQVQQGGVIMQPQLWPVNVAEVVRCTALAIRRRGELLGPLAPFDSVSKNLVLTLARAGTAPPNHWSTAWVDVERGMAHAAIGEVEPALEFLERGTLVGGQLDHPLTGLALLEQGKLALDAGEVDSAAALLAEASYSAFVYEDAGVVDEAFRLNELAHLASGSMEVNPTLAVAGEWARRERFNHIGCRLNLGLADQLMLDDDWDRATAALAAGESQLNDARNGLLGNRALFLEAKLDYHRGRESGATKLDTALEGQAVMSVQNFQIGLANTMFDAQTLPVRSAPAVYELLLSDPTPNDAVLHLLESMAVMSTSHDEAFQRWLVAALERGNMGAAIEVTDRAKRRRFHNAMPWGGRLAAVRSLLAVPEEAVAPANQQLRNDLLGKFPDFAGLVDAAADLRKQLQQSWLSAMDDDARRKTTELWKDYTAALHDRELGLADIGLSPAPAEHSFPPLITAGELQTRLAPGQAVLVFHDTPEGLLGFLFTAKAATHWNCGPSERLAGLLTKCLRDMGNYDATREMTTEDLAGDEWQESSHALYNALLEGASLAPSAMAELIVIPDGITWYVPFEALVAKSDETKAPLISFAKVRYAPTVGLAFSFDGLWRRVQRTGLVTGEMVPGEKPEERAEAAAAVAAATPGPFPLDNPSAAPSTAIASLLDALIVLADVDATGPDPLAWSPLPIDRGDQAGSLDQWLAVAGDGPQRILLPGMHTLAERGGKPPRRRGAAPAGSELFYASCSMMSAGAETILLSRWRVGGQSTLDIVREFVQELPNSAAADAWKRSIELAAETPVDPKSELRVKAGRDPIELTAKHPFFWAGYLVVDSGWAPPIEDTEVGADPAGEMAKEQPAAAAPAAAPVGPAQPAEAPAGETDAEDEPPAEPTPPKAKP